MRRLALVLAVALTASVTGHAQTGVPADPEWRAFTGAFTATGRLETVPKEDGGVASTLRLSGSLVVTADTGLGRGFHVEALGFDDGQGGGMGRAVWTDDRGDRIYSRIAGIHTQAGRRSSATFTGGTGRYAGITGDYSFVWQYVVPGEQGFVQARAVSFSGRYRRESPR
jgi:hypothetical protein